METGGNDATVPTRFSSHTNTNTNAYTNINTNTNANTNTSANVPATDLTRFSFHLIFAPIYTNINTNANANTSQLPQSFHLNGLTSSVISTSLPFENMSCML